MKLWIDDVRPAPEGYRRCKSVNKAKQVILDAERKKELTYNKALGCLKAGYHKGYEGLMNLLIRYEVELIDIDHDAGDFACDGGDYIKILDWLEETGRNYPIRIHSANPVGVENMRRIIKRNNWKEVF